MEQGGTEDGADGNPRSYPQEDIVRISVRNRVFALGGAAASVLALSLAAPASANAAPPAPTVRSQATVVPNEVGKNVGTAISDVQAAGLRVDFRQTIDVVCEFGKFEVTDQRPAAGSVVDAGSVVTLTFVVRPKICP